MVVRGSTPYEGADLRLLWGKKLDPVAKQPLAIANEHSRLRDPGIKCSVMQRECHAPRCKYDAPRCKYDEEDEAPRDLPT